MKIEVCVDNVESLHTAVNAGADRIELCSALALGGLSPSIGLLNYAVEHSSVPIYAMVRPRAGDFVFSPAEIDLMCFEIEQFKTLGVAGVVLGLLNENGEVPIASLKRLTQQAQGMGLTFHRAFDLCADWHSTLELAIDCGFERILTSGQQSSAALGTSTIAQMVASAKGRISIMPGSGVTAANAQEIVEQCKVDELHLSGKGQRASKMQQRSPAVMGRDAQLDNWIDVTDFDKIKAIRDLF